MLQVCHIFYYDIKSEANSLKFSTWKYSKMTIVQDVHYRCKLERLKRVYRYTSNEVGIHLEDSEIELK